jgi:hypothetical protein
LTKYVKQHYVPRFYLRNFCAPESDALYCFDKVAGKSFPTTIKNLAHENLFYGLRGAEDALEQGIARVESRFFVKPYNELLKLKNYRKLSHQEKGWFCIFLAFQHMRSNDTRLAIKEMREKLVMELAKDGLFREKGIKLPDWLTIKFTDAEYVKALHVSAMVEDGMEPFFEMGKFLFYKTWLVLRNLTDSPLWTSDNPISLYNGYGGEGNLGIVCPGVEIRFPLSSKLLLFSYDPKTDPPHRNNEKVSRKMVDFANQLQIVSSTRFIFSNSNNFDLAKNYLQKYPKYKKPSRSRFKVVLKNDIIETIPIN